MRAFVVLTVFCVFSGLVAARQFRAPVSESQASAAEVAGLQDTLLNGLEARLPVDRSFIKKVVKYVNTEKLALKPVMEIFAYCRKKISPRRRATVFRILMTKRAKGLGVHL